MGLWGCVADPAMFLNSFVPSSMAPYNPLHSAVFSSMGAAFFLAGSSQAILLRYTSDIGVWKILNGCFLGWDFIFAHGIYSSLVAQGRLDPAGWRGEDWWGVVSVGFMTVVRAAIVLGVGLKPKDSKSVKAQ